MEKVDETELREKVERLHEKQETVYERIRSWGHCFGYFKEYFGNKSKVDYDLAALNLGMFLASWGMYRGSSFSLQYDYKIYAKLLEELKNKKYDFDPCKIEDVDISKVSECFDTIKNYLKNKIIKGRDSDKGKSYNVSATFVTKIMLGIYGITPAFDKYFIEGIKDNKDFTHTWFWNVDKFKSAYEQVLEFYKANQDCIDKLSKECQIEENKEKYKIPPMRIIDMYFWLLGKDK